MHRRTEDHLRLLLRLLARLVLDAPDLESRRRARRLAHAGLQRFARLGLGHAGDFLQARPRLGHLGRARPRRCLGSLLARL